MPVTAKSDEPLQGTEVLRIEGDLYLYTAHADAFLSNPNTAEAFQLMIAKGASVDVKNVEVSMSIPKRIVEAEWQKKAKGNVLCQYIIHVMSMSGDAAAGDAVMKTLSDVDEVSAKAKLEAIFEASNIDHEVIPVSMTMKPYRP
mmetsp:Transcript_5177/g.9358  ORF Transcript_5177/g.9358 Transcript_5177/m.9358 type:complete len:144 (-) Transcript_5177:98-529(-)